MHYQDGIRFLVIPRIWFELIVRKLFTAHRFILFLLQIHVVWVWIVFGLVGAPILFAINCMIRICTIIFVDVHNTQRRDNSVVTKSKSTDYKTAKYFRFLFFSFFVLFYWFFNGLLNKLVFLLLFKLDYDRNYSEFSTFLFLSQ